MLKNIQVVITEATYVAMASDTLSPNLKLELIKYCKK